MSRVARVPGTSALVDENSLGYQTRLSNKALFSQSYRLWIVIHLAGLQGPRHRVLQLKGPLYTQCRCVAIKHKTHSTVLECHK